MAKVSTDYINVVWGRFKRNRVAYYSLWLLALLFAAAIFAPCCAPTCRWWRTTRAS